MSIDEKALRGIIDKLVDPWNRKFACDVIAKYEAAKEQKTVSLEDSARVIYNSLMGKYDWEGGSEEAKATCTKVASAVLDSLKAQGVEISYVD